MLQSPAWELGQLVRVAECLYRGHHCEYLPPCYRSSCTQNYTPRSVSQSTIYIIYTPCLLSILYLHTVSTFSTISTHRVYHLYHIYTRCVRILSTYLLPSTVLAISMDTDHVPTFITVNVPTSCSCFVNDFVFY